MFDIQLRLARCQRQAALPSSSITNDMSKLVPDVRAGHLESSETDSKALLKDVGACTGSIVSITTWQRSMTMTVTPALQAELSDVSTAQYYKLNLTMCFFDGVVMT